MELDGKERQGYMRDEYILLQNQYEDYDRRALTIKGWIGSGAIAALALAFTANSKFAVVIPIYVAIIAVVFWYLETKWKMFQYASRERIQLLESYFRGHPEPDAPFQIYIAWYSAFRRLDMWAAGLHPFVCSLYIVIIGLSVCSVFMLWK